MDGLQEPGPYLWIDPYPADVAVAISDSLFNRTIEVSLTCDQEQVVAEEDSCVQFNLNFTNARCVYVCFFFLFRVWMRAERFRVNRASACESAPSRVHAWLCSCFAVCRNLAERTIDPFMIGC